MREAILAAAATGRIEELRTPLEWNELKPELAETAIDDPIAFWRRISTDGEGREILAILDEILRQPYAVLHVGRDAENNRLYVWPRFAETPRDKLTPAERDAHDRLIPPDVRAAMSTGGKYLWWRLAIGADGTWHAFSKGR